MLFTCSTKHDVNQKQKKFFLFELPNRAWSLLQIVFVVLTVVFSFGNIFLQLSRDVPAHTVECTEPSATTEIVNCPNLDAIAAVVKEAEEAAAKKPILTSRFDAVYFSTLTLTTIGAYGDFEPPNSTAKGFVLLELFTGLLIILCVFPLVFARVADF